MTWRAPPSTLQPPGTSQLPPLPNPPTTPCADDADCAIITAALDPVFPSQTRSNLNIPGTCQHWAREWLRTGKNTTELPVERVRQRYTMALLYCEFNGDNWLEGELWVSELHECDWYTMIGVDPCNRQDEYQILRINGQPMRGTIPPELSMLSSLWEVSLADNLLSGEIPSDLSKLAQLDTMSLSFNLFEGTIPKFMWEYEDTTYLDLASNFFTGTIPNTIHLTENNLNVLFVENNDLSGAIPSTFGSLDWQRLHPDGNQFSGPVPTDINSANMVELYLHNNQLTGSFPAESFANDFAGKSNLKELTMYNNKMSGDLDEMCNLVYTGKLEVFEVYDTMNCQCCSPAP